MCARLLSSSNRREGIRLSRMLWRGDLPGMYHRPETNSDYWYQYVTKPIAGRKEEEQTWSLLRSLSRRNRVWYAHFVVLSRQPMRKST